MRADAPSPTIAAADAPGLAEARLINAACERFEAAWRAGAGPRVEDEIGRAGDPDPPGLVAELIALEVELRRERGHRPEPAEYRDRFPGHEAAVAAAFVDPTIGPGSASDATVAHPEPPESVPAPLADWDRLGLPGARPDFGDFELLEEVARGGMGIVYKARKRSLNCLVALKVMQAGPLATELDRRRFLLEAEAAANLDHPNIVPVFEIDRVGGLFFTMKWVDGGSLADQVLRLRDDPTASARLVLAVARAVHDAHNRGYLHRDLKPTNILVDPQGRPYVTDFGLAIRIGDESHLTQPGAVLGTPSYMAPEQAAGKGAELGPAADVYSLGAILYELLVGRPPFRAATVMETLVQVLEDEPVPPRRLHTGVAPELESICLRCLEKAPGDRYPTAEALADDLERFLRGDPVRAMRGGLGLLARRWTRHEPQLVSRLLALGTFELLTQFNYALNPHPDVRLHLAVSATLALWAVASLLLQAVARRGGGGRSGIPVAWLVADIAFLTTLLWLLDGYRNSMAVGYPLLVAASGLWFRVELVWLATALAEVGYALLIGLAWQRGTLWDHYHHPNIVVAAIAVAGFIVARQVRRLLALSSFYEDRLPG